MDPFIERRLMANGAWAIDLNYNAVVDEALEQKSHALFFADPDADPLIDDPYYVGVLTSKVADSTGITIGGPGLAWWLGSGDAGPLISEAKFISLRTLLSNGDFELNSPGEDFLYWSRPGDSKWVPGIGAGHLGSGGAALVVGDPLSDDVLSSTEPRPAAPGEEYYVELYMHRGAGLVGHLRARIVFTGRFMHPDVHPAYSGWDAAVRGDIVLGTDPLGSITGPTFNIRTAIPNLVIDGSFDDGIAFTGWTQLPTALDWDIDTDGGHNGPNYAFTDGGPAWKELAAPAISVAEGEEYEFWMVGRINPGSPATDGEAHMMVGMTGGATADDFIKTSTIRNDNGVGSWQLVRGKVTVDAGRLALVAQVVVEDETGGRWDFDDLTVIRTKGNIDTVLSPTQIAVTPERTYRWSLPFRGDLGVNGGRVQLQAIVAGPDRPAQLLTGPELRQPNADPTAQVAQWDIVPPSGYNILYLRLYAEDVTGGSIIVGQGTVVDQDSGTVVYDTGPSANTYLPWTANARTATAPDGTTGVRLDLVAESLTNDWVVDSVYFARFGVAQETIGSVVTALLLDPDTGLPQTVVAGTIHDAGEVIPYDWTVRRQHCREALDQFATVVCDPPREWHIDDPTREMEFGLPEQVFDDRTDVVLLEDDIDVGNLPPVETNTTDRVSKVLLLGADRPSIDPLRPPTTIEATAVNVTGEVDWDGNPLNRTKVVGDASADHLGFAGAKAAYYADLNANPAVTITATLSGPRAEFATVRPGDWIYVFKPAAGLVDMTNPVTITGRTVYPRKIRVLSIRRKPLDGKLAIRLPNGTIYEPPGVQWGKADEVELELGDRRPEFVVDPQGGSGGKQFLSWRKRRGS